MVLLGLCGIIYHIKIVQMSSVQEFECAGVSDHTNPSDGGPLLLVIVFWMAVIIHIVILCAAIIFACFYFFGKKPLTD